MSESTTSQDAAPLPRQESAMAPAEQAGAMLRQAREEAGLHVAALAVALKVPVHKLEALEAGRFDLLPDMAFARGLAASICRGLKLDPKPVLDLMPSLSSAQRNVAPPAINARFEPGGGPSASVLRGKPTPTMWIVGLLLLGALAVYLWPVPQDGDSVSGSASEPTLAPQVAPGVVTEPVQPEPLAPAAPPAMPTPPVAPAPEPAASAAPPVAEPAPAAAAPVALLQFNASAQTWVQVTDAQGQAVLRRTLQAGETATADGTPPLSVVVGRADAVTVQVRGAPRDLRDLARNNVARFEVK